MAIYETYISIHMYL